MEEIAPAPENSTPPEKTAQAPGETHTAQPELGLGDVKREPAPAQASPKPTEQPPPKAPAKARPSQKKPAIDPVELERLASDYTSLKASHETLQASIASAQTDRRLQVIRAAGVEALGDEEILKLAPEVDPDTSEGRQKINAWIDGHPGLVAPRYKMQAPKTQEIADQAMKNHAVATIFGSAETVRSRIKTILGGE